MKCLIGLERRVITEVFLAVKGVVFDLFHRWILALIQRRAATIQANIVKLMIGKGRSGMAKGCTGPYRQKATIHARLVG